MQQPTMKLSLPEWKSISLGQMQFMLQELSRIEFIDHETIDNVKRYFTDYVETRLEGWRRESAAVLKQQQYEQQVQQQAEQVAQAPLPPPPIQPPIQQPQAAETAPKRGGWPKGRKRTPRTIPEVEALITQ